MFQKHPKKLMEKYPGIVERLWNKKFLFDQIIDILHIIDTTCPDCWETDLTKFDGCACWDDD